MFKRLPGIGLDIGSKKIKMIQVVRRKAGLEIIKFGSLYTPPGSMEAGIIVDPVLLGEELKFLVRKLNLSGKRVVSAVGGQQLYIRNLIMPRLKLDEMREAVYYQSANFLPIPVEEVAIDIYPMREFENQNGKKTEVFFLAVRKQQVDNLEMVCRIAELNLAVVEIEPLSIYRAWGKEVGLVVALLAIGSSRSYLTVFNRGIPVFYRSLALGSSSSYYTSNFNQADRVTGWQKAMNLNDPPCDPRIMEITNEVKSALEYYQLQMESKEQSIEKIVLCGGGAMRGLEDDLTQRLDLELEVINILSGNILPRHISPDEEYELQYDFPLALGLAAREVV